MSDIISLINEIKELRIEMKAGQELHHREIKRLRSELQSMKPPEKYLGTKEVAAQLGVSARTVTEWANQGKKGPFPNAKRPGDKWLIDPADLRKLKNPLA